MTEELKDRKTDKQVIVEKTGKKKIIETNSGKSFTERSHGRKHESPKFTDDNPAEDKT
ncbi:hypothetical protein H8S90_22750 [Olivibacter sp. SDN3]|uniref:hypothetical protein n=1 Tax=Olivibacter sp. SDN3 TaxID=2764720 RepID=UPI00165120C5|nr:hypothetical protein [Olivibacter sp. SDN3]QNL49513.1 hypothetical protein H8S90_22750 [Olivibacter sp. SDN3]